MLLKSLFNNLKSNIASVKIRGISFDTRSLRKGDIFVSIKGNKLDGKKYIKKAISKGAKARIIIPSYWSRI